MDTGTVPVNTATRSSPAVLLVSWFGVLIAGLVVAFAWLLPWPAGVFWGAVLVGLAALLAVMAEAVRTARATGVSMWTGLWRSFASGLAFLRDFL